MQQKYVEEIESLKNEARSMLMAATSTKLMILIDTLERLGLAYHFESEIDRELERVYDSLEADEDFDLFSTTLRFRLLRQYRYHVSCSTSNITFHFLFNCVILHCHAHRRIYIDFSD